MALMSRLFLFFFLLINHESCNAALVKPKVKAVVLPVVKDPATGLYTTVINQRTPLLPVKLAVDLSGHSLWVNCDRDYNSSSYRSVNCKSSPCAIASPEGMSCGNSCAGSNPSPWHCNKNACYTSPTNPFSIIMGGGTAAEDVISFRNPAGGKDVLASRFVFSCANSGAMGALPKGVTGVAGLGTTYAALPAQLGYTFGISRKFQLCLSPSPKSNGVLVFGDFDLYDDSPFSINGPMQRNLYSLSTNHRGPRDYTDYYFNGESIRVNGVDVPIDAKLMSFYGDRGAGGIKFSTADPYTVLKTALYTPMVNAFVKALPRSVKRVSPVKKLGACFSGITASTRLPAIELGLGNNIYWNMFNGTASMVEAKKGVMCLGFVEDRGDAGYGPDGPSIQLGPHQLADHMLEFDLTDKSPYLSFRQTSCAQYKV